MKTKSYCSTNTHPYRAGLEIGEQLAEIQPEVIFLFASIHYEGSPELAEGIYDALESASPVIIGTTSDGFYERETVGETGVSALAINSEGSTRWHLACETDANLSPERAVERCMTRLTHACRTASPSFYFLCCDFRMDTTQLIQAIQKHTSLPVIGGSGADDYQFSQSFVYANHRVLENSIAILAVEGALHCDIFVSNDMLPVGNPGIITDCHDRFISTIDSKPACRFVLDETGSTLNTVNQGSLSIRLTGRDGEEKRLRSLLLPQQPNHSDAIQLFGGVQPGDVAQLCCLPPEQIIADMNRIAAAASTLSGNPQAALMVSCAGRKRVLGNQVAEEVAAIRRACPAITALAGLASFGEFGPLNTPEGYTRSLFHNMTCFLLVLREGESK